MLLLEVVIVSFVCIVLLSFLGTATLWALFKVDSDAARCCIALVFLFVFCGWVFFSVNALNWLPV